jgi:hypothetical protein
MVCQRNHLELTHVEQQVVLPGTSRIGQVWQAMSKTPTSDEHRKPTVLWVVRPSTTTERNNKSDNHNNSSSNSSSSSNKNNNNNNNNNNNYYYNVLFAAAKGHTPKNHPFHCTLSQDITQLSCNAQASDLIRARGTMTD